MEIGVWLSDESPSASRNDVGFISYGGQWSGDLPVKFFCVSFLILQIFKQFIAEGIAQWTFKSPLPGFASVKILPLLLYPLFFSSAENF